MPKIKSEITDDDLKRAEELAQLYPEPEDYQAPFP